MTVLLQKEMWLLRVAILLWQAWVGKNEVNESGGGITEGPWKRWERFTCIEKLFVTLTLRSEKVACKITETKLFAP